MKTQLTLMASVIALLPALACGPAPSGGSVQLTASGEALALGGYDFPSADPAHFVDGWEVRFTHFIFTFDHVQLAETPDKNPGDQSQTGKLVAQIDGPWAIDLHLGGPLTGAGGADEQAFPFATFTNQNQNGNAPFDATTRYAFSFAAVPATASAQRLKLDAAGAQLYDEMIAKGWVALYAGHASYKGGAACNATSTIAGYDWSNIPTEVDFKLGFASPTRYVNCQNPSLSGAPISAQEEHQRGVQIKDNSVVTAQVTMHTDHPFWESTLHDSPAHFDALAALARLDSSGKATITIDDTIGVDFRAFKDRHGNRLPYRSCDGSYTPPTGNTQLAYDSRGLAEIPGGDPARVLRDFADFLAYNQSTQGHLNADGLCAVLRDYPSPP